MQTNLYCCSTKLNVGSWDAFLADRIYEFNSKATGYFGRQARRRKRSGRSRPSHRRIQRTHLGRCAEISNFWVSEHLGGKGLGKALLRAAEAEACVALTQVSSHHAQLSGPGILRTSWLPSRVRIAGQPKGHRTSSSSSRFRTRPRLTSAGCRL